MRRHQRGVTASRIDGHRLTVDWPLGLAFAAILLVVATFPPPTDDAAVACLALVIALAAEVRKRAR